MQTNITLSDSGGFTLHLLTPHSAGQHIEIPFSIAGLKVLRRILRNRESEVKKIGDDSSPIQFMVDKWLRAAEMDVREEAKKKLAESAIKVELDLDLEI